MELRRGALVLAILSQLEEERYGYSLRERLREEGLEVNEGTLYPLLRRLEGQGLLDSRWRVGGARPRRYYRLSRRGRRTLASMRAEWESLLGAMERLLTDRGGIS